MVTLPAVDAAARENPEILLYAPDHPANAAAPQSEGETPEWLTRVPARPSLIPYLLDGKPEKPTPACIVCPGGGYAGLSMDKEGVEPAQWLNKRGIAAFVLRYRCGGGKNQQPVPLQDAQRAIRLVRSRADEWSIDVDRVGIWGFSAGGHLASSAAVFGDEGQAEARDPLERRPSRLNFAVLVYPVISMELATTHSGSRDNLLGPDPSAELVARWSTDLQVTAQTPPTFLVHASDDTAVLPENSLRFYRALLAHEVPCELHIYQQGGHGFGMLRGDRPADHWPEQLAPWLREQGIAED